ncbi:hypothetical protein M3647_00430 [Paenibacillus cellulositrophicus]|uniref:hypothetical protein n=1 Tax=Paenibacillus cellulositrophicus TaxID=562959 RepID=UPI00204249B8|nr:hypothetical protein [Paenibacillus cellulositrophicus]MCM2995934.1 hypothetical protein [Paenibacillus cellulositrophicus]
MTAEEWISNNLEIIQDDGQETISWSGLVFTRVKVFISLFQEVFNVTNFADRDDLFNDLIQHDQEQGLGFTPYLKAAKVYKL